MYLTVAFVTQLLLLQHVSCYPCGEYILAFVPAEDYAYLTSLPCAPIETVPLTYALDLANVYLETAAYLPSVTPVATVTTPISYGGPLSVQPELPVTCQSPIIPPSIGAITVQPEIAVACSPLATPVYTESETVISTYGGPISIQPALSVVSTSPGSVCPGYATPAYATFYPSYQQPIITSPLLSPVEVVSPIAEIVDVQVPVAECYNSDFANIILPSPVLEYSEIGNVAIVPEVEVISPVPYNCNMPLSGNLAFYGIVPAAGSIQICANCF